ncbi:putative E3 ubiquitin-protein ligase RF4 isoform X1 [Asparagus officinalis]|uniref:putative E3 ubiquitin-protein ligase RF4 isoform X1 n=1 Tax=Asparagus officinalis TaxID=4686 RepID=UPI00098E2A4B|nr:putative E3 ubiquitin-protein ligase RF4 isoform X1 [Asparagus officinalis]XP_020244442.1 putative E3 ubiquitin-protein ligase RF4 isoform X1 [Asparagus officinalis]
MEEDQSNECDLSKTHDLMSPVEEVEQEQFQEAEWSNIFQSQLEEIALGSLDMIFQSAITMIISHGYSEEIATNAVLRARSCDGSKDSVSNVMDNALTFLRSAQEVDSSIREISLEKLKEMERSILHEMVHVVRDYTPSFSRGDAMWKLLICDMNVSLACAVGSDEKKKLAHESNSLSQPYKSDNTNANSIPKDEMDEVLHKLNSRERELQARLQDWSEWAQKHVMQVAGRLAKDKTELQRLRQEEVEVAGLMKDKQSFEKKIKEMLQGQRWNHLRILFNLEKALADARKLERENSKLKKKEEAAKLQDAESAARLRGALERESNNEKKLVSEKKQEAQLQEELAAEKKIFFQLQKELEKAKEDHDQVQARWKQEERAKEEALIQVNSQRKGREQIEVSGRAKENEMRLKAETDVQRYKDNIKKLEKQIEQIEVEKRKEKNVDGVSEFLEFLRFDQVPRHRECVMCVHDEISVVFLPCAHQVLCEKCNELHERLGVKLCPYCRTLIEKRILVRDVNI